MSLGELNRECDSTLLSVTSCECPECDCHFSTRTNFPDKYLMRSRTPNTWGVTISDNLVWSKHITTTTTKANARLSFIKRNLKDCPQKLMEIAYFSLVRSFVDYASAVWDPHQKFNQVKLEMVQRRAARFVKSRYKRTDSVTAMLDELGWPILSKRRKDARLILFYKIINNLAQVPHEHILAKAYEGTRKKNNHKFRHIAVNTSQYRQSFFPKTVGPWNQLSFADSPTLENFRTNLLSTN